jgi:hypothetical protein
MGAPMTVEPQLTWPVPPERGWIADDLDRLPNLPPHMELLDGSLVFTSPRSMFHVYAIRLLEYGLLQVRPAELAVIREMTVTPGERNRPEPDLMVVPRKASGRSRPVRTRRWASTASGSPWSCRSPSTST